MAACGALLLAACLGACGCSKGYEQKKLGKDSAEGQRVSAMVQELRSGGEKGLGDAMARQAADGLTEAQTRSLQATLRDLIRAEAVELERLDTFGRDVYRATFQLTAGGQNRSAAVLLVSKKGDLRWAGRN